jgi:hypothetical protein
LELEVGDTVRYKFLNERMDRYTYFVGSKIKVNRGIVTTQITVARDEKRMRYMVRNPRIGIHYQEEYVHCKKLLTEIIK